MATGCGYSYRDIDDMYLAEAEEIFEHWRDSPPTYQMVALIARMLGWEPKHAGDDGDESDLPDEVFNLSPEEAALINKSAGVTPVISLDAMREKNRQKMVEMARKNVAAQAS